MSTERSSRRDFLLRVSALGAAGAFLSACGGGGTETAPATNGGSPATNGGSNATAGAGGACSDASGLSAADAQQRETMISALNYVEESPNPEQLCSNCNLYLPDEQGSACGGCTLIKGPVAPGGYCTSWVAASAA